MYLGLDLGTSGLKALLMDAEDAVLATAQAPLAVARPRAGWSEQDPSDWIAAAEGVLDRLAAEQDLGAVEGIGLSGQMHGATILDAGDRVLRPCILWDDTRAHAEAAALDAMPAFRDRTGNIVFPGFTAPKISWLRANEPDIFAQTARVLLPKDHLRLWLTGEAVSEMSDAAGTAWLDTGARDWSDALLEATGLDRGHMPALVEGNAPSGALRAALADRWGMPRGVVVAGGGGDNAATAVAAGAVTPGRGFVSLGTSGVLFAAAPGYAPAPATAVHTFCHALPQTWHQMGVVLSAAGALDWAAALTATPAGRLAALPGPVAPPGRSLFLPYLGGERTPHNDARIRGALTGISHATDAGALARAVMEGVAFALADCRDALAAAGTRLDRLVAMGGGARSEAWLAILATALVTPIEVPAGTETGAALGAARLARMAATGTGAETAPPPAAARSIDPDPGMREAFAEGLARYRATHAALRELS